MTGLLIIFLLLFSSFGWWALKTGVAVGVGLSGSAGLIAVFLVLWFIFFRGK